MKIYYIETEGWVTEEWLLNNFIDTITQRKQYELFKNAIMIRSEEVKK